MLMLAVVAPSVVPVVQGKTNNPCDGLTKKKCNNKKQCTFFSSAFFYNNQCYLTAGNGSIVRDGSKNVAPGTLCTVGGGQQNRAGYLDFYPAYSVIGGGVDNLCVGDKSTISGGNKNIIFSISLSEGITSEYDTISGGSSNGITDSTSAAITGGGGGDLKGEGNSISYGDMSTISGGKQNIVVGSGNTLTGGFNNVVSYPGTPNDCVVTGGNSNNARKQGSVVMGGQFNTADGKNSLALGQNAVTKYDHSMVVNLMDDETPLKATQEGHFLVNANSFRFQVGNGESATLTSENISRLKKELLE